MQRLIIKIFLWGLLILAANVQAQSYQYDVIVFGKKIGTVTTKKERKLEGVIYTSDSKSEVSFFGKKRIVTTMKTVYKNDTLMTSFYEVRKNGKVRELSEVTPLNNGGYQIVTDGEKTTHSRPVTMSTILLTYRKPKDGEKIFEEVGGYYKTMKKVSEFQFDLINPKSRHKDSYFYNEAGVLTKCIVRKTLFNFQMILKPQEKLTSKL
ncbi:exported hypothetical protein [Tenacibaculum litopenaei]|uniref:DUF6134 family protein n=1 Tax=Tenacibaculum litopenaei TaxID=396016 RepID=UPI0038948046